METRMPSYMVLLLALHKTFTNLVPELRECARPRAPNLQKNAFLGCCVSLLPGNSFKKYFTPDHKLKALFFLVISSSV